MKNVTTILGALIFAVLLILAGCTGGEPEATQSISMSTDPGTTAPTTATEPVITEPEVTEPSDPVEPTQPTLPTEPTQPTLPTEPTQPTQPTEPLPPSPTEPVHRHNYTAKVTSPTCTKDGFTTYRCSCGNSYTDHPVPATDHSWGGWTTVVTPSEFVMGKKERACTLCLETEQQYIPNFNHSYMDDTRMYETGVMEYDFDQIPDYMLDSKILRALEFTGYDLQFLIDQQLLYHPDYIGFALEQNQSQLRQEPVLSGIKYSNRGRAGSLSKKAVTAKELAASVTGRVPDIPLHLKYGMSCTSFVEYFLLAYLPHCEGVNVSAIENTHTIAAKRFTNGTYTYIDLWTEIFEGKGGLISQGLATHYEINVKESQKHTAEYNAIWRKIQPGTIIRFGNNSFPYIHYAVYVGTYNNLHYIAHVGNDRGPEIVIAESLGVEASDDPSWPIEFYDLHLESIEKAAIQIVKTENPRDTGLAGACFVATNQATGTDYYFGPTTDTGYSIIHGLPYGTYLVREITPPDGYAPDNTTYTVTVSCTYDLATVLSTVPKASAYSETSD